MKERCDFSERCDLVQKTPVIRLRFAYVLMIVGWAMALTSMFIR